MRRGQRDRSQGGAWGQPQPQVTAGPFSTPRKGAAPFLQGPVPVQLLYPCAPGGTSREKGNKFYSLKKGPSGKFSKKVQLCFWKRPALFCFWEAAGSLWVYTWDRQLPGQASHHPTAHASPTPSLSTCQQPQVLGESCCIPAPTCSCLLSQ